MKSNDKILYEVILLIFLSVYMYINEFDSNNINSTSLFASFIYLSIALFLVFKFGYSKQISLLNGVVIFTLTILYGFQTIAIPIIFYLIIIILYKITRFLVYLRTKD